MRASEHPAIAVACGEVIASVAVEFLRGCSGEQRQPAVQR